MDIHLAPKGLKVKRLLPRIGHSCKYNAAKWLVFAVILETDANMQLDEKARWNQRYSEGSHTSLEPDPLLVSAYDEFLTARPPRIRPGRCRGMGRHALWLAQRG